MTPNPADGDGIDVLICGGGPVGLLIAYCLARYGISTYVLEQHERAKQTRYGRAAMIAPRTLEMLDQLDLADALGQIGFVVRGQVSFKNGERVENITAASSNIRDTFFDYLLLCRQRYTEDVIRDGYARYSERGIHNGARLVHFSVAGESESYAVTSIIESQEKGRFTVRSKYIIGADGGRSSVRELAGIKFEGERSNRNWIRVDGIVETNMPEARRGICGVESPSHGSILWACLDHGVTRVGFALPEELWERLGGSVTQEDVIREAQKALQPFTLEFKTVDWWTVYSVGQRLAADYRVNERVFLAGDAAHTHSSGAAQGMNTGLHDAVNLSWKLAGHLNGWLADSVLDTYATERRPIAEQIINQDKIISVLTGGEIPDAYKDDPEADPHKLLTETYKKNASLNTGLGIRYAPDGLLVVDSGHEQFQVLPGERAPDVLFQRPGMRLPVRLQSVTKNNGKFTILLFCGDPSKIKGSIRTIRQLLIDSGSSRFYMDDICSYMTIIASTNDAGSPVERLGVSCFGQAFYDVDALAHERYGVAVEKGAIYVLRPDGTVGTACHLEDGDAVSRYFDKFVIGQKETKAHESEGDEIQPSSTTGEVDLEREDGQRENGRVVYKAA